MSFGVNVAHFRSKQENYGRSSGTFTFGGSETGTGLSDFLMGRHAYRLSRDGIDVFPRLADPLGFVPPEELVEVAKAVIAVQRDYGNRENRKRARLKYTIDDHGLDWRLESEGHDEVASLSRSLNHMLDAVSAARKE